MICRLSIGCQVDSASKPCERDLGMFSKVVLICETGAPAELLASPRHPYTRMLLAAVDDDGAADERPPEVATEPNAGCAFAARCPHCMPSLCRTTPPLLNAVGASHEVACHRDPLPLPPRDATLVSTLSVL